MIGKLVWNASFFALLTIIDRGLAEKARDGRCPQCGAALHWANYRRKPRGTREDGPRLRVVRFSLCCSRHGCRRRLTPPSVRFLGRKVYLGGVVVLASALAGGLSPWRKRKLKSLFGVSDRTLRRWCEWWRETFADSLFWKAARGRFRWPVDRDRLPLSLLERFSGSLREKLRLLLKFLSPITTASAPGSMAF
jgi:hypothetical protein